MLAALEKYTIGESVWRMPTLVTLAASCPPIIGVEASAGTKIVLSRIQLPSQPSSCRGRP
ncbi:hypothetical protein [Nonomuraea endophytica]|uniref:hypothetical protein n=1 Tax=Nonomuraea endophytica TaxID=714136 RepID=UPI0037C72653